MLDGEYSQRQRGQHATNPAIVGLDRLGLGFPAPGQDLLGYRFFLVNALEDLACPLDAAWRLTFSWRP